MADDQLWIADGYQEGASYQQAPDTFTRDSQRDQLLMEIIELVVRARNISELFQELAPRILQVTGSDFLKFALHDPAQDCMISRYRKKNQESFGLDAFPVADCISGWVWMHQEVTVVADIYTENRFPTCLKAARDYGVRSYCVLPLTSRTRRFGALGLGKNVPGVLNSQYLEFVRRLAAVIAMALEIQEANRAREEQRERSQSLLVFAAELHASLDMDQLLHVIFAHARRMTKCDYASLVLLEGDENFLQKHVASWIPSTTSPQEDFVSVRAAETVPREGLELREVAIWSAGDNQETGSPQINAMLANGVQSVCGMPLLAGGKTFGTLLLGCLRKHAFRMEDLDFLGEMGNVVATGIQNADSRRETAQLMNGLAKESRHREGGL